MNTKQQGDIGVAMAIAYYTKEEYVVSVPLTDNARYDLIIEKDGVFSKVQCKSTNYKKTSGNYEVTLRTSGGNQSWNRVIKTITAEECDLLFVYAFDGRKYEFPPEVFDKKTSLSLATKYDKYQVIV